MQYHLVNYFLGDLVRFLLMTYKLTVITIGRAGEQEPPVMSVDGLALGIELPKHFKPCRTNEKA